MDNRVNSAESRIVPLLPEQRRFLTRGLPGAHHWNQVGLYRVPPELTAAVAATAMCWVVNRHEGLRMRLTAEAGPHGIGMVEPPLDRFPVDDVDLSDHDDPAALTAYCTRVQESLRLEEAPMVRVARIAWKDESFRLLIVVHHYITDGVGFGVLLSDFEAACRSLLAWSTLPVPKETVGAHEFAGWLEAVAQRPETQEQHRTWLELGRPCPPVPLEKPGENTMATTDIATVAMSKEDTDALFKAAGARGRTSGILETILAALIPTLDPGTGVGRIKTNLIGHGRYGLPEQPRVRRTVGWLSTRYPVNLEVHNQATLMAQRDEIARQLERVPLSGTGFGLLRYLSNDTSLREELARLGDPDVTVNYRGRMRQAQPDGLLQPAKESPGPAETSTGTREHVHGVDLVVEDGRLTVIWYFSTNQFSHDTVSAHATELCSRIRAGLHL